MQVAHATAYCNGAHRRLNVVPHARGPAGELTDIGRNKMRDLTEKAKSSTSFMGAGALLLLVCAGCGSPDGAGPEITSEEAGKSGTKVFDHKVFDDEAALNLIAEVNLPTRTLKFFEPERGVLLQVEKYAIIDAPLSPEEQQLSGSALYEYLAKSPAPQALLDAEERATPLQDDHGLDAVTMDEPGGLAQKTAWMDGPHPGYPAPFRSQYCTPTDRYYERLNRAGNTWIHTTGTNMMQAGVFAYTDGVDYYGSYNAGDPFLRWEVSLSANQFLGWRYTSGVNRVGHSEVWSGPGTRYDHCVNYHY
jgi:hypothetical protein